MSLSHYLDSPITNLQTLVASSPTFQSLVGAANAAQAVNSVFLHSAPGDWSATRAIVGALGSRRLTKTTSDNAWQLSGPLFVEFEIDESANVSAGEPNHNAAGTDFLQKVSAILDDLLPLCGQTVSGVSYLDVVEIVEEGPPMPCDPSHNQGKYFWFTLWKVTVHG